MVASSHSEQHSQPLNQWLGRSFQLNWEVALYILIFALAIFTRFHVLGDRVMSHDESLHTRFSYNLYKDGDFAHTPLMHGPILFHATAFSYYLFGDNDFTSRIYTAVLGVAMVMFPLLFRRWLGRWGSLLASTMLLISPLILYYNRYIRHDTPSILFAMIMAYCILMYINGPLHRRRKSYWLYIFSAAMVLNLGSKETAFLYIAIFWSFLFMYWLVRMGQARWNWQGKKIFYTGIVGILLGGVMTLGLYILVDIIPVAILPGTGTPLGDLTPLEQSTFFGWLLVIVAFTVFIALSTVFWAFKNKLDRIPWGTVAVVLGIAVLTALGLLFIEEVSHTAVESDTPVAVVPGEETETTTSTSGIRWFILILEWLVASVVIIGVIITKMGRSTANKAKSGEIEQGTIWDWFNQFPEFDYVVLIFTLVLPWATAIVPYIMRGTSADYSAIAQGMPQVFYNIVFNIPNIGTPEQVGQFFVGLAAFIPLAVVAVVIGLAWNWKRWLISAAIFHSIFLFFFTTVFTNMAGIGSGMVYSLGYWLEQQGVRRGNQPQYYYLLIIMPVYEFLPVIGGVLAMFSGMTLFWRGKRREQVVEELQREAEVNSLLEEAESLNIAETVADDDDDVDLGELAYTPPPTILDDYLENDPEQGMLQRIPFLLFIAWWAILNLVGYSLAGEKMPWLGTHLTTPLVLLTGWYFGGVISKLALPKIQNRGWLLFFILPTLFMSLVLVFGPLLIGNGPFTGLQSHQLQQTYSWLVGVALSGFLMAGIFNIADRTGWRFVGRMVGVSAFIVLSVITFRAAWMASFINYDLANEFLVYAHAAPAVKTVLDDIEELSFRTTDGKDMVFAYDDKVSWPYSWYFRDYTNARFVGANPTVQNLDDAIMVVVGDSNRGKVEPILEDRYYRFDHIRLWWPMQEYFHLTAERVTNALDFSRENETANLIRQGMFDIWWNRDYTTYGEATSKDFSITNWPVADRMHVYVRKDFAAQIWAYGVGDGAVFTEIPTEVNLCIANWMQYETLDIYDADGLPLVRPLDIEVDANGTLYIAEEYGNRVSRFDADGNYLGSWTSPIEAGDGLVFNRPNGLDVAPDGSLYIVDTWNYRIQHLSPEGEYLTHWGQAGEFGFDAPIEPKDAFWGPRDVVVDDMGRIYVTDTGNKRIRVYQLNGLSVEHLYDFGEGGSGLAQLDEPSGLAYHPDGRLYVADTWNRRVSIFDGNTASFIENFTVRGWYEQALNRPYLALDIERDLLYVTDPDSQRVLIYDTAGNCMGSFGSAGDDTSMAQFSAIGGVTVDSEGFVYVTDSTLGQVFKFPPYAPPAPESSVPLSFDGDAEVTVEVTDEVEPSE